MFECTAAQSSCTAATASPSLSLPGAAAPLLNPTETPSSGKRHWIPF